jgi:hypothetical protein
MYLERSKTFPHCLSLPTGIWKVPRTNKKSISSSSDAHERVVSE